MVSGTQVQRFSISVELKCLLVYFFFLQIGLVYFSTNQLITAFFFESL